MNKFVKTGGLERLILTISCIEMRPAMDGLCTAIKFNKKDLPLLFEGKQQAKAPGFSFPV